LTWPKKIEQWREPVGWECKDLPPDLVLAVMSHESGGIPGRKGSRGTRCGTLPTASGGKVQVCGALGLMQIHPLTVSSWNEHGDETAYLEDMTGDDERAIRIQIRLGCWYLASCVAGLHQFDPTAFPAVSAAKAGQNQLQCALIGYAVGLGALKKKLKQLQSENKPLTYDQLVKTFPEWGKSKKTGKWINRPLHYAAVVWDQYAKKATGGTISTTPPGLTARIGKAWNGGGWLIVPIVGAVLWSLGKRPDE
jgi:hypothetical protein